MTRAEARLHGSHAPAEAQRSEAPPEGQWRLLASALLVWACCAWAIHSPGRGIGLAVGAFILGTVILLAWIWPRARSSHAPSARYRTMSGTVASLLLLPCAALVLIGGQVHRAEIARNDPHVVAAASEQREVSFMARVTGFPETRLGQFEAQSWVRIDAVGASGRIPMLLWLSDADIDQTALTPGANVRVSARLVRQAPHEFVAYTASPSVLTPVATPGVTFRLGQSAARIRSSLHSLATGQESAMLVPGLAIGDTSLLDPALDAAMLESSLTHLTAVSGGNIGLVVTALTWSVAQLGAGLRIRTACAAFGLGAFVVIVGPDASVQRAAVMAGVLLIGAFGGNTRLSLPALGAAVVVLLAVQPWQSLQAGFALSVVATGGILLLAPFLGSWFHQRARLPRPLALALAVALSAQLACGPVLLLIQPGVPAIGVMANLLAAPAAPIATGLGLVTALLAPIHPQSASVTLLLASVPAGWIAKVATVTSTLPGGRWHWPDGWPGALLFLGCELAMVVAWALGTGRMGLPGHIRVSNRVPWRPQHRAPVRIRATIAVLASLSAGTFSAFTLVTPIATRFGVPNDWVVVACDVGQGDAVLLRSPKHQDEIVLVDTGDDEVALRQCLDTFRVHRIALLVLTHDDRDHVGALNAVVPRVDRAVISPTVRGEADEDRSVVRQLEAAAVPYRMVSAGDTPIESESGPPWQALSPPHTTVPRERNAASIVMLFDLAGTQALMLADTGRDEQSQLLQTNLLPTGPVDIVKVAHHGSRDQNPSLYQQIQARWALVSVGLDNGYGHPTPETLATLADLGTTTLRTDEMGSVALVARPDGALEPWIEHAPAAPESNPFLTAQPSAIRRLRAR